MQTVKQGKSVAVVERFEKIGGNCTHLGTIPSKALRYSIFSDDRDQPQPAGYTRRVCRSISLSQLRRSARRRD